MASTSGISNESRRLLLTLPFAAAAIYFLPTKERQTFHAPEVGLEAAKVLIAAGALILDVRESAAFVGKHILGALSVPLETLRVSIPAAIVQAKEQSILVYCGDGSSRGPESTAILNKAGYAKAVNLEPGFKAWANAGLPVAQG